MDLFPTPTVGDSWNPSTPQSAEREWNRSNLRGISASTSSAAASPVRTSVSLERAQALKAAAAAYGKNTPELLGRFDHDTPLLRTFQLSLEGGYSEFSGTFGRSGTMRNGTAYLLQPLVRLTDETDFGLWPTVTSRDHRTEKCSPEYQEIRNADPRGKTLPWEVGGALNPTWVEWLQGFPPQWTEI
jgi:hypothetical protein